MTDRQTKAADRAMFRWLLGIGPTRADALRAAWAYITSRQEPTP